MSATILFVDDDIKRRNSARLLYLEDRGYLVLPYDEGRKAIEAIEEGLQYDLAIIDLSFGEERENTDCRGDEVMSVSKRRSPKAPIICSTGYPYKPQCADYFLQKGTTSLKDLVDLVETALRSR